MSFVLIFPRFSASSLESQTQEEAPRIVAHTLSLKETVYIMYAVKFPSSFDGGGIIVFEGTPPAEYGHGMGGTVISENLGYTTLDGEKCYVFAYSGLSSKEMSVDVYAVPYVISGGEYIYGSADKYSIIQYANAKMSGESEHLLRTLLDYGAAAQEYFGFNTQRLANADYVKVSVQNALLPDGMAYGMYLVGESLPPPLPKDGEVFGGWFADPEYKEPIRSLSKESTVAYARWHTVLANADFAQSIEHPTASFLSGGVLFNAESLANLSKTEDPEGKPYVEYTNGAGTSIRVSRTHTGKSLSDMTDTDVFSYSVSLMACDGLDVLTSSEIAIESNKTAGGDTKWCKLNLATIEDGGRVKTYSDYDLGVISTDAVFNLNVAVDFSDGSLTYYGDGGETVSRETFTPPKASGAKSAKAWQALVQKYPLYIAFDGGEGICIFGASILCGNIFSS
ncbi:MAG: hypothetical protein IKM18_00285 [Clostridia bacterium]|nr:hypothetical protein [Clostridia bacterium]